MSAKWFAMTLVIGAVTAWGLPSALADTKMASVYTRLSGPELADLFQKFGYKAELSTDDDGDPKIVSAASGANFVVFFYGCNDEEPKSCDTIQFSVSYTLDDKQDAAIANKWNQKRIHGRFYIDENGDPMLDHNVVLTGGVTEENLRQNVRLWEELITSFKDEILPK